MARGSEIVAALLGIRLACARGDTAETAALMHGIDVPMQEAWPDPATHAACRAGRASGATLAVR